VAHSCGYREPAVACGRIHESAPFPEVFWVIAFAGLPSLLPQDSLAADSSGGKDEKANLALHIAPVSLEIGHGRIIKTVGYNGSVPGPVRFREEKPVTVDVFNQTDVAEVVHWHARRQ